MTRVKKGESMDAHGRPQGSASSGEHVHVESLAHKLMSVSGQHVLDPADDGWGGVVEQRDAAV
jgi:hypothetical protein